MRQKKRTARTGRYTVRDTKGQPHIMDVYATYLSDATQGDEHSEIEDSKSLRLTSGEPVNWIAQGKYQLAATGEELTCDDPNAP